MGYDPMIDPEAFRRGAKASLVKSGLSEKAAEALAQTWTETLAQLQHQAHLQAYRKVVWPLGAIMVGCTVVAHYWR